MVLKNREYLVEEVHRFDVLLESREIFLHAYVDNVEEDPGVEYRMANMFIKNMIILERLSSTLPIIIHQHSVGGNWTEGMMMYDAIYESPCPVAVITHGIAASMGSIVPQAADLRVSMPNCWWLIHDGTTDINQGLTMRMAKSWHVWEEKTSKQMLDIYTDVCSRGPFYNGKSDTQVRSHIIKTLKDKEDWWLSSNDSSHYGFSDMVYGGAGFSNIEEIKEHVIKIC